MMNKIDKLINLFIERISFNLYKQDKNKKSEKDDIELLKGAIVKMEQLNRKEIIELVNAIINPKEEWSEAMVDELIFKLKRNVIYPNPSDLIFYTELSA